MGLSQEDLDQIAIKTKRPLFKMLKLYKQALQFELNCVLIKTLNKEVEQVSANCPVPKKYKVVHIDDCDVRWVKVISVKGGLGANLIPLISEPFEFTKEVEYHIDPELLNATILGYKYDARKEYKNMRDLNPKYGKKLDKNL